MTEQNREPATPTTEALKNALAYALTRAKLPGEFDTSRDYAGWLAPLVLESGYLPLLAERDTLQERVKELETALRSIQTQVNKTTAAYWTADHALLNPDRDAS